MTKLTKRHRRYHMFPESILSRLLVSYPEGHMLRSGGGEGGNTSRRRPLHRQGPSIRVQRDQWLINRSSRSLGWHRWRLFGEMSVEWFALGELCRCMHLWEEICRDRD